MVHREMIKVFEEIVVENEVRNIANTVGVPVC